ncbi:MAG: single-stranded-DNA-specific exonuclease RecJ [Candidatus Dojkabacteria bacterium]
MSLQTKREWILPEEKIDDALEHILESRGVKEREKFLNPTLEDIPSYKRLFNSKKAAKEIVKHIEEGSKIVIYGDYDADGISATAILWEFLYREVSSLLEKEVNVLPYIPDRVEQGYGLTEDSLNDLVALGANLVITVDCGIRDKEIIQKFKKEKKINFVVTDHHQPPEDIEEGLDYTVVHQMFPKKEYPYLEISGTTVVYLLIQALIDELGMEKNPYYGLDLVALTTVTDVMPLIGVNRVFVKLGLEEIRKGKRLGLRMLALRAGIQPEDVSTYHLGFVLGPRINASGRIDSPMEAVRLLVSKNEQQCKDIANKLETMNFNRQQMTSVVFEEAREMVKDVSDNLLFAMGLEWHEGIIGLVAGKLQEEFYKPTIVITKKEDLVKGSARSIKGFNITKALEKYDKYLDRYGGHELAAGFSTSEEKLDKFIDLITKYANKTLDESDLIPKLEIEILLELKDIKKSLVQDLNKLEPLGFGNPKPYVCLEKLNIDRTFVIGKDENHLKLLVKDDENQLTLLLFRCSEDIELLKEGDTIDVVGYPDINVWNGKESMQFNVREWRYSN